MFAGQCYFRSRSLTLKDKTGKGAEAERIREKMRRLTEAL